MPSRTLPNLFEAVGRLAAETSVMLAAGLGVAVAVAVKMAPAEMAEEKVAGTVATGMAAPSTRCGNRCPTYRSHTPYRGSQRYTA